MDFTVSCGCGKIGAFAHLIECVGLRKIPQHQELLADCRADTANPGFPEKFIAHPEICLEKKMAIDPLKKLV